MVLRKQEAGITRRQFIRNIGIGAAALGAAGLGGAAKAYSPPTGDTSCTSGAVDGIGKCQCPLGPVDVTLPAIPSDPADFTDDYMYDVWKNWDYLGLPITKDQLRWLLYYNPYTCGFNLIDTAILNPYFPFHWLTGAMSYTGNPLQLYDGTPLQNVKTPADFPGEGISGLGGQTYRVEVEVPAGRFEIPNPLTGMCAGDTPPDGYGCASAKLKIRGWYIKGIRTEDEPGALVIMHPGRTTEFTQPVSGQMITHPQYVVGVREQAYRFALAGFDVWLSDKRGHGISDGICSGDNVEMADDVFRAVRKFESGDGVLVIGPVDSEPIPRPPEPGELLPSPAEKTPLILWGSSQGSFITMFAMTKHILAKYGSIPTKNGVVSFGDVYPLEIGRIGDYSNLNVAGFIGVDGVGSFLLHDLVLSLSSVYFINEWAFDYNPESLPLPPAPVSPCGINADPKVPCTGTKGPSAALVYESMAYWPSLFQVHGAVDKAISPESCVRAYNKARGMKGILLVKDADHSGPFIDEAMRPYVISSAVKFATKALNYNGALNNTKQTTLQAEACQAAQLGLVLKNPHVPWNSFLEIFSPASIAKIEGYVPKQQ